MPIQSDDLSMYLLAIKHSYEQVKHSEADSAALRSLYVQGGLHRVILNRPSLLGDSAKAAIATFEKTVKEFFEAPEITSSTNLSYGLNSMRGFASVDALPAQFDRATSDAFRTFMADFLGGLQADILSLVLIAKERPSADADYVIGMAEITAQNFGSVVEHLGESRYADWPHLEKFFADGCRFVSALREQLAGELVN